MEIDVIRYPKWQDDFFRRNFNPSRAAHTYSFATSLCNVGADEVQNFRFSLVKECYGYYVGRINRAAYKLTGLLNDGRYFYWEMFVATGIRETSRGLGRRSPKNRLIRFMPITLVSLILFVIRSTAY